MGIRWLWKAIAIIFVIIHSSFAHKYRNEEENVSSFQIKEKLVKLDHIDSKILHNAITQKEKEEIEEFIETQQPHSRKKRLIWVTDDGRLALPPGTTLSITPTIALPLVRHPPEGFLSNLTISFPVTIDFDKLGLTDNQNPLGELPPIFARSFGKAAGQMLGDYIAHYVGYRKKRDLSKFTEPKTQNSNFKIESVPEDSNDRLPELPEKYKHIFHGGERALLYGAVEDLLSTFGMNGKACLLRTICEVHSKSIDHLGFLGETLKLFLTATKSPFAEHIPAYVKAQQIGEGKIGPGECFPYYKDCPKSLFKANEKAKYSENEHNDDDIDEDDKISDVINNEVYSQILKSSESTRSNNIPGGILSM